MTKLEKAILSYWHENWWATWGTTIRHFVKAGYSVDTVTSTMKRLGIQED